MTSLWWLNAILRSAVWFGASLFLVWRRDGKAFSEPFSLAMLGGIAIATTGVVLHIWSNVVLANGERQTRNGKPFLVSGGPFLYTRNPIYLAGFFLLIGCGLITQIRLPSDLIGICVIFALFHFLVTQREEPSLRNRIGAQYDEYCNQVPRWMPRIFTRRDYA
jgi:protein-S-isoprenylcysteine O-methyltransferase Ste14